MKPQWNKKYTTIAVYTAIVSILGVLCVFFFLNFDHLGSYLSKLFKILSPLIYGAVIAYLLNPVLRMFEEKVFRGRKSGKGLSRTARRGLSVAATMLSFFVVLALFIWMILPQLVASIKDLGAKFPTYIEILQKSANDLAENGGVIAEAINTIIGYINDLYARSYDLLQEYLPKIADLLQSFASTLLTIVLGLIFSVYFLFAKEQITAQSKKLIRAIFAEKHYRSMMNVFSLANKTFNRYLIDAIFDSFIIGVACFVLMEIFRMPYAPLISVIVGVTNIIPFFGPFIGAAPSAVILFVYKPVVAVYFVIMILVLQQLDGNVIKPKLYGNSTGLAPVWIITSITIMSSMFGFAGMLFGFPVFAVLYMLVKKNIEDKLAKKQLATDTLDYVDEEHRRLYEPKPEKAKKEKKIRQMVSGIP